MNKCVWIKFFNTSVILTSSQFAGGLAAPFLPTKERISSFSSQTSSEIRSFKPKAAFQSDSGLSNASIRVEDDVPPAERLSEARQPLPDCGHIAALTYTNSMCLETQADEEEMPPSPFKRVDAHTDGNAKELWMRHLQQCDSCSSALGRSISLPGNNTSSASVFKIK